MLLQLLSLMLTTLLLCLLLLLLLPTLLSIAGPTEIGVVTNVGREDLEIMTGAGVVKRIKPEVYYKQTSLKLLVLLY
jgi:hypothetical protein